MMTLTAETLQKLYRYACSLTQDESHAYDLVHDAIEKYCTSGKQAAKGTKKIEHPEYYLRTIIRNRYIDQLRHTQRFPLEDIANVDEATAQADLQQLDNTIIAEQTLDRIWPELTVLERELLHLWALEGFTAKEIAIATNTPRGTILSRIHRLKAKIEKTMTQSTTEQQGGPA